jgi:REP-associated tyrosine transposase
LLADVLQRHAWRCLAFCQLTTHYHLVVETTLPDLAVGIKRLNQCYAQSFNRRHRRKGHLFESRYSSIVIADQAQLSTTLGYVHLNPARAGICSDPADWEWCSFAQTVCRGGRGVVPTRRALELIAPTTAQAARRLSEHVYERLTVDKT